MPNIVATGLERPDRLLTRDGAWHPRALRPGAESLRSDHPKWMRDYERQPWDVAEDTELHLTRNFGKRETIHIPSEPGGHAGGDPALHKVIFGGGEVPAHMRVPSARAGALSCLTGIAARKSVALKRPVNIAELIRL